jgi:hypothetical protein
MLQNTWYGYKTIGKAQELIIVKIKAELKIFTMIKLYIFCRDNFAVSSNIMHGINQCSFFAV